MGEKVACIEHNLDLPVRDLLKIIQHRAISGQTSYFGVKTLKNPLDMWVYQEIIVETGARTIVEIGNKYGGSTLYFAHLFDLLGEGRVIAVDIEHSNLDERARKHPRITWIEADAVGAFSKVNDLVGDNSDVMVIEDSSHTYENTLAVLRTYSPLVSSGNYLIVEDSICHHGLDVGPKPGPYEAIESFIEETDDFEIDRIRESFFITWNPKGFLRRKSS